MNDDQLLLALAYLDDELSPEQRASVDDDPELRAEVERWRAIRRETSDVAAPDADRKERSIAAALAEFAVPIAAEKGGSDVTSPPPAAPITRASSRWRRPLQIAAAVVIVGALGVVANSLGRFGGDADNESSSGEDAAESAMLAPTNALGEARTRPELAAQEAESAEDGADANDNDAIQTIAADYDEAADAMAESTAESTMDAADRGSIKVDDEGSELIDPVIGEAGIIEAAATIDSLSADGRLRVPSSECPLTSRSIAARFSQSDQLEPVAVYIVLAEPPGDQITVIDRIDCTPLAVVGAP